MAESQMNMPGAFGSPPAAAAPTASAIDANKLPSGAKSDYDRAMKLKEEGDKLVKSNQHSDAIEKYNQCLNVVRGNDTLKKDIVGADVEIRARSNLALCKHKSQAWAEVIDHSERILEKTE